MLAQELQAASLTAGADEATVAEASVSIRAINLSPAATVSPFRLRISTSTPFAGAGSSRTTLSVSDINQIAVSGYGFANLLCQVTRVASATDSDSCGTFDVDDHDDSELSGIVWPDFAQCGLNQRFCCVCCSNLPPETETLDAIMSNRCCLLLNERSKCCREAIQYHAPWLRGSSWHQTISVAFGYFASSAANASRGKG